LTITCKQAKAANLVAQWKSSPHGLGNEHDSTA
jgi:hypothetical protein